MVATHDQTGLPNASSGRSVVADLRCDGGIRPNPGTSQPVVHDRVDFLPIPARSAGTNHGTIYDALDFALNHARKLGAYKVTITFISLALDLISDFGAGPLALARVSWGRAADR